jgi:hypothetical protein
MPNDHVEDPRKVGKSNCRHWGDLIVAGQSIVAWRLFMITLIARTTPSMPCSEFLSEQEWKVLTIKSSRNGGPPVTPPTISEVLILIARLGGYLARKYDGPPGTLVLWRGWKRMMDLTEGWRLANQL